MENRTVGYQRSRQKFAAIVYLVTFLWLLLGLTQWLIVILFPVLSDVFEKSVWISGIFFALAIILTLVFLFIEVARTIKVVNWILSFLIVEFVIVGVLTLVARSFWPEMIMWLCICIVLLYLAILLGSLIPHDLTLDVVILFVVSFILLITSVFLLMLYITTHTKYFFIMYQIVVSCIILAFVMYHAQTINGERFAEMRVTDYLLASVILFFDFTVLFLLTFYVQTNYTIASLSMARHTTIHPNASSTTTASSF